MEDIAAALKMAPRTFLKARDDDPNLDLIIAEARAETGQQVADKLVAAALDGSVEAAKFILERKFRWLKETRIEHSGEAGPSIKIMLTTADGQPVAA